MNIASTHSPERDYRLRTEREHPRRIEGRSWKSDSARSRDEIRFGIGKSSLGMVLVGKSRRGICAVLLGSEQRSLVAELYHRFPRAIATAHKDEVAETMAAVIRVINTGESASELVLAPRGTEFQLRVWKALREIPTGSTATYKEIAEKDRHWDSTGSWRGLRGQRHCNFDPVSSCRSRRRQSERLSLGHPEEAGATAKGARSRPRTWVAL